MLIGAEQPERNLLIRRPLDPTRRRHPHAIRVKQKPRHHRRMIRWLPAARAIISTVNRAKVQLLDHLTDNMRQVVFRQPIAKRERKQKLLIGVIRTESR